MENYQQKDGSIEISEKLISYFGKDKNNSQSGVIIFYQTFIDKGIELNVRFVGEKWKISRWNYFL